MAPFFLLVIRQRSLGGTFKGSLCNLELQDDYKSFLWVLQ